MRANMAKVVVLTDRVIPEAAADQQDAIRQAQTVMESLDGLGFAPVMMEASLDFSILRAALLDAAPALVFNLVESLAGEGRFIHLVPALLDGLEIHYTGAPSAAVYRTSHKLLAKRIMLQAGIPTPEWVTATGETPGSWTGGLYIVKSVWEHASLGLEDDAVVPASRREDLLELINQRSMSLGGSAFAEAFIDGREFNLSLLGAGEAPDVLPAAEILFEGFPPGKKRLVGYRAKWDETSFEYQHTIRSFEFSVQDQPLLERLADLARHCWRIFGLRGYARVDFRVDKTGCPMVLEVNANPCLSPEAGFAAAAARAGLGMRDVVKRIVAEVNLPAKTGPTRRSEPNWPADGAEGPALSFRTALTPADLEAIRGIVASSGFFYPAEVDLAVSLAEERLAGGAASGYHFLLAESGGQVLGYACFGPVPGTGVSYDLYWIAVADPNRGLGLGRSLLARSEKLIAAMGGERIYVETSSREQYAPTRRFYEKAGYRLVARLEDFYYPHDHKMIYLKEI